LPVATFAAKRANALSVAGWRPLYEDVAWRCDDVQPDCARPCAASWRISRRLAARPAAGRDPRGPVPRQRFFPRQRASGLIDFYFACTDTLAYDVAICLNAWCFETDHSYNVTKGRDCCRLMQRAAAVRQASLMRAAARRGAALRFLLTRLVDWLDVPPGALVRPKDPLEYFRKLRFHQAVASVRDYGIG
jgi:homoserine kinase type II